MPGFDAAAFLPPALLAALTQIRVDNPRRVTRAAARRRRRDRIAPDGKLNILAADHPARRVTSSPGDPIGMTARGAYLARILRVLLSDHVDGLMATMDVLEELLLIDDLIHEAGREPLLDGKLLLASLNRGGLAGSAWELDDPMTGATPQTCADFRLDGAKILLRIADDDPASLKTLSATAEAIIRLNALNLPTFLEPLPVIKSDSGYKVVKTPEALARIVGVASALGDSSRLMWLKLPACPDYHIVARSTTMPILLLGGESAGDPTPFLTELHTCLQAGPNVRGALVGRNVLYPGDEDPLVIGDAAGLIIHNSASVASALQTASSLRSTKLNLLQSLS